MSGGEVHLGKVIELNPTFKSGLLSPDDLVDFLPMAAVDEGSSIAEAKESRELQEVQKGYTSFSDGDVLLAKITPCFENGKIAQVHLKNQWGFGSTEFHVLRPHADKLDGRYLVHFLRRDQVRIDGERKMTGSAGQRRVPKHFLETLSIRLPPLPEQRRIAAILDQADTLRAKRREALVQLDSLTQSIFIEMFGDPSEKTAKFANYPLHELLEGDFQNGAYFPKEAYVESGVEMVHMSDAFGGVIKRGNLKRVKCSSSDIEKYSLTVDDLIIARRSLTYDGAAKPCMVPKADEALIFESSFIRVRPNKERVAPLFLFHYLNNNRVREKFVRPYVTQSTISGINQSNLSKVPVMLPPMALQREFYKRVEAIEVIEKKHVESVTELNALFASLQHRAFRGEI